MNQHREKKRAPPNAITTTTPKVMQTVSHENLTTGPVLSQ